MAQLAISAAWGTLPWLLWSNDDLVNHLFILLAVSTSLSSLMISRATNMWMFLAGMVPLVTLSTLRFATGGSWIDAGLALHQVRPYRGTAERISIAFNLSL